MTKRRQKSFLDLWLSLNALSPSELGDIKLAGFLLQHWFTPEIVSVASVGLPSKVEFLALNSLVDESSSFAILNTDPFSPGSHTRISELSDIARQESYSIRFLITDMTLPARWTQLLSVLTPNPIGILRLDAAWALSDPQFWSNLGELLRKSNAVVCIRGLLDFHHADVAVRLLASAVGGDALEVIAATPTSVWLGLSNHVDSLRELLRSSCLFGQDVVTDKKDPVVVLNTWMPNVVDDGGRFVRKLFGGAAGSSDGIEFAIGWAAPEPDGRWSDGPEAIATVSLPPGVATARRLTVTGNGWVAPSNAAQRVEFFVGTPSTCRTELRFDHGSEIKSAVLELTPGDVVDSRINVNIRISNPSRPCDYGEPDSRVLGFKFRALGLFT
jgi:hypothetical protein